MASVRAEAGTPRRASIRALLLRLVLAVALPLAALAAWDLYETARDVQRQARAQVFHLAEMTASDTARFLVQAQDFLNGLAERPAVRALDPSRCDTVLKDLVDLAPRFANAATMTMDGRIVCSAVPSTTTARAEPGRFLELMRAPDQLTVGIAAPGVITGRWIVPIGRPLLDAQGAVIGAVVLPIDLLRFPVLPNVEGRPADTAVGLVAGDGTVLAHSREPGRLVGTNQGDQAATRAVLRDKKGTGEEVGIGGVARIQGFTPVSGTDWIAVASVPASDVYAGLYGRMARSALIAFAILAGALLLAVRWSRQIHDPITDMARAAGEVAAGNLAARAPVAGAEEIAEVAVQFNRMLDARAAAEQRSRAAEARFEKIFRAAPLAAAISSVEGGRLVEINAAYCALTGRPREALIGRTAVELGIWDQPQRDAIVKRLRAEGRVAGYEANIRNAAGETHHLLTSFEPIDYLGESCMLLIGADITERKRMEEALMEREEFLSAIMEYFPGLISAKDLGGTVIMANSKFERLDKRGPAHFIGKNVYDLFPKDVADVLRINDLTAQKPGAQVETEELVAHCDGTRHTYLTNKFPLHKDGKVFATCAISIDMTERKQAEKLLAGEKEILESVASDSSLGEILEAVVRIVESVSSGMLCSILLLDADGVHLRHGEAPSLPDDYNRAIDGVAIGPKVGSCGTAAYRNQLVIVTDIAIDPLWDDFRALALQHRLRSCWSTPIRAGDGRTLGTFALYYREPRAPSPAELEIIERVAHLASIAIERKRAGAELRHAEGLLRTIVEGTKALLVSVDASGHFTYANEAAATAVGLASPSEMIGKPYLHFVYPEDRSRVFNTFLGQANAFQPSSLQEFRLINVAGELRWFSFLSSLTVRDGQVVGQSGVAQDVTVRKRAELALQKTQSRLAALTRRLLEVQEEERRRIARELHDEIGGVLTAVKINLQSLRRKPAGDRGEAALAEGLVLVDGAIQSVRMLSLELRPAVLDDLGLIPALKWYSERQAKLAGVPIELALDAIDLRHAPQLESACFRIVQESVTNALRHARAQRIRIALRRTDGAIVLEIADAGCGFDVAAARARALAGESSGLLGMEERATLLGGSVTIESAPGAGTRVRAQLSLPQEEHP